MGQTVAYVMSRFPHLPETFILREMNEVERQGWGVALYPLIWQQQAVVHAAAQPWMGRGRQVPFLSKRVVTANGRALRHYPQRYARLWAQVLWENRTSPNFLLRAAALLPKAIAMAAQMEQEGIAHIHAHYATHPALVAWLIHRLTGISYSVTVHAHDIFVRTEMLATKLRDAAFVVAISDYNRDYLTQRLGAWVRPKIHIVHCGIIPAEYTPRQTAHQLGERFEIITVGSLQPYKGQQYLIAACAHLQAQGLDFRCRIVGGGEERPALEAAIKAAQLESVVELLGPQPQEAVARLLPTAHCYVQPSIITPSGKMEGIPVALMEALACQVPTIATAISGIPELVRPDQTGWLVPPADALALAEALAAVHAAPDEAQRRATAGRALVLAEFQLQANVQQLVGLFARLAGAAPAPQSRGLVEGAIGG